MPKAARGCPPDIRLSVDRTAMHINNMRTAEEIVGFFSNAMRFERGVVLQDALHDEGLLTLEDIGVYLTQVRQLADGNRP